LGAPLNSIAKIANIARIAQISGIDKHSHLLPLLALWQLSNFGNA
jgi:hypothetical protein